MSSKANEMMGSGRTLRSSLRWFGHPALLGKSLVASVPGKL